ncbi:MAG: translation factor GTPase family protein [Eubacteriaceae bacterium]|nr:translation factor GTPase family protein [Eubacteriaceae bacterium]
MNRTVTGILAHVDSGKTTLAEAILYSTGEIKKPGRVDHGDAFLDTEDLERDRGITIFSKEAVIEYKDIYMTLLDTPGHVDFGAEMERTLDVLDRAILVISGTEGVQSHTDTLWKLLESHSVPTYIFINKMDIAANSRDEIMSGLKKSFGEGCVELSDTESVAMCDEPLLESFLAEEELKDKDISKAISERKLFPCCFGSALKHEGVETFINDMIRFIRPAEAKKDFGAKVFKISRDDKGIRLTHMKITGGRLQVRSEIGGEKVTELRVYSGSKYRTVDTAPQGTVCAAVGLDDTAAGMGLGTEPSAEKGTIEPVMSYKVRAAEGMDPHHVLDKMLLMEEEEPELHVVWNEQLQEIHLQLMGDVQLEILEGLMKERYDMDVSFDRGSIIYKETVRRKVEGVGHFEPLRHYAEVHLLLEPLERGSGMVFATNCSEDDLDKNWQRLIMTHLEEKEHIGTLTGSPLTDTKITLVSGRAHEKHTEGGDFRQATYRAVRQGLMEAGCILLEPWYGFTIQVPSENTGRAMSDIQRMGGRFDPPEAEGEITVIEGSAPADTMGDYRRELSSYTKGRGSITCFFGGYDECHDAERAAAEAEYDPERDIENTGDSIFCEKGSGFNVKWDKVKNHMHLDSVTEKTVSANLNSIDPKELDDIFQKTYGVREKKTYIEPRYNKAKDAVISKKPYVGKEDNTGPEYLLVDGYNLIFAWPELKSLADADFGGARDKLVDILCNYQGYTGCRLIVVFDAYKVSGGTGSVEHVHGIDVVYTKEAETADMYIERVTHQMGGRYRVRVATSDGMEQMIILGHGAIRVSSRAFIEEIKQAEKVIADRIK